MCVESKYCYFVHVKYELRRKEEQDTYVRLNRYLLFSTPIIIKCFVKNDKTFQSQVWLFPVTSQILFSKPLTNDPFPIKPYSPQNITLGRKAAETVYK